jgi:nicotinamidase/pyrazinamidase
MGSAEPEEDAMDRRQFLGGAAATALATGLVGPALAQTVKIKPGPQDVLLVVDVQNCFVPGGTLPVAGGDQIVPLINKIARAFEHVVLTQDWHTAGHASFASSHPGKKPFETVSMPYGTQVLWPDHCVQGTADANLHPALQIPHAQLVIRKGHRRHIDSYSAFYEADGKTPTGLSGYLKQRGLTRCFVAGLATDFCVAWTALDARKDGFAAFVIEDACRGIDTQGSLAKAWTKMKEAGVKRIRSSDLAMSA